MEAYISSLIRIDDSCTRHHFFPIKKHIFAHKKTSLDNIYKEKFAGEFLMNIDRSSE